MRKIILLVLLWVPCTAFAATHCLIIEYADHWEATCIGNAEPTSALSQTPGSLPVQAPEVERSVASAQLSDSELPQISDSELPDIQPEMIVRNELARLHGDYWLKTRQQ